MSLKFNKINYVTYRFHTYICNRIVTYCHEKRRISSHSRPDEKRNSRVNLQPILKFEFGGREF